MKDAEELAEAKEEAARLAVEEAKLHEETYILENELAQKQMLGKLAETERLAYKELEECKALLEQDRL